MKIQARRLTRLAVLTALCLLAFLVEELLPPLIIPGAKLGLANIFILLCLIIYSLPEAILIVLCKCIVAGIFGGVSQILYSLPSGIISVLISYLLIRFFSGQFGLLAICALSAAVHNLTQLAVFAIITKANVIYYAPYLTLAGIIAGAVTGAITYYIIKKFPSVSGGRNTGG